MELTFIQWLAVGVSALIIGVNKTGMPGVGILAIPLMAMVVPARMSTGMVLPMLIIADLFAVIYYRRKAVWFHLVRLLPWAVIGIIIGWLIMGRISDRQLQPLIGGIILLLLVINAWRRYCTPVNADPPRQWWIAPGIGILAGITTMLANAAGPIMVIYLLTMRLEKEEFIGTGAWYFFLLNWFKIPFSAGLGLITWSSLKVNLVSVPVIALGAMTGIMFVRHLPQRWFTIGVEILAVAAAGRLILS